MKRILIAAFLMAEISGAYAQGGAAGIGGAIGGLIASGALRDADPDAKAYFENSKGNRSAENRVSDSDDPSKTLKPIIDKATGAGEGAVAGSVDLSPMVGDSSSQNIERKVAPIEEQKAMNSKVGVTNLLGAMNTEQVQTLAAVNMIDPAVGFSVTNTQQVVNQQMIAQGVTQPNGDNIADAALVKCAEDKISKAGASTDPVAMSLTYAQALQKCIEENSKAGPKDAKGTTTVAENSLLSNHAAHPSKFEKLLKVSVMGPDRLTLVDLLTNRKLAMYTLAGAVMGAVTGASGLNKKQIEAITNAKEFLLRFGGNVVYKFDGKVLSKSQVSPISYHQARYEKVLAYNYEDLRAATRLVCDYENRVNNSDSYVPFSIGLAGAGMFAIPVPISNNIWTWLQKGGKDKEMQSHLKFLSAGPAFGASIAIPVALNQLFINYERVISEGDDSTGTGQRIKIKCEDLTDSKWNTTTVLKGLKDKDGAKVWSPSALPPRVRHTLALAHAITMGQLAFQAYEAYQILDTAYGAPKDDAQFVQNGQYMAIKDLRVLLANSLGARGDELADQSFGAYYARSIQDVVKGLRSLGADVEKYRGTSGGTLAGSGGSAGAGNPFIN